MALGIAVTAIPFALLSSAGDVQDRVGFARTLLKRRDRFGRRKHEQFDLAARGENALMR